MGAGQSVASDTHPPVRALHVLRVTPSSPASLTDIEPFFDFVVGFEGDAAVSKRVVDATGLERIVENHEGKPLNLLVWNSKRHETRVVSITPSREWAVQSPTSGAAHLQDPGSSPSLLGLSMRMCEPEFAVDNVWHVLDVLEGSPAESAGLVPYGDWIIGWSGGVLSAEGDFYDVVESHVDKPLRVYVYSYDFDTIREVVLVPNRQWGGEGLLGCVFGFGLLHRIPEIPREREPGALPPELLEPSDGYDDPQLFVPAEELSFEPDALSYSEPRSHTYTPPIAQEYSYSYNDRGSSYSAHTQHISSALQGYDRHSHNSHTHDDDHHHHHEAHGHGHGHSHGHIHDSNSQALDHGYDQDLNHDHAPRDNHSSSGEEEDTEDHRSVPTPRPGPLGRSPNSRGLYANGLRYPGMGRRSSLADAPSGYSRSRTSSPMALSKIPAVRVGGEPSSPGEADEADNEVASDYGSLTSVE